MYLVYCAGVQGYRTESSNAFRAREVAILIQWVRKRYLQFKLE
jgi:hypothetical protein